MTVCRFVVVVVRCLKSKMKMVHASRVLNLDCRDLEQNKTIELLASVAPHIGEAWERLVLSMKIAIELVADASRQPDDETLETMIVEKQHRRGLLC